MTSSSPADLEHEEGDAETVERRLLRARVIASLALASTALPLLTTLEDLAREGGAPAWGGVGGGWLAIALCLYLPLHFLRSRWPLRCALGSSLWAAGGAGYGLARLLHSTLLPAVPEDGLAIAVPLLLIPTLGVLCYRWIDSGEGYALWTLPAGLAVGLMLALGLTVLSVLFLGIGWVVAEYALGDPPSELRLVFPRLSLIPGLVGLQIGTSFGLAQDGRV